MTPQTEHQTSISTTERPAGRDWMAVLCVTALAMLIIVFAAMVLGFIELHRAVAANTDASKQLQIAVNQLTLEQSIANRRRSE